MAAAAEDPAVSLQRFHAVARRDAQRLGFAESWTSWIVADRMRERGDPARLNFYGFDGREHLLKFFNWLVGFDFPDYFASPRREALVAASLTQDRAVSARLGLSIPERALTNVAAYNMQDYLLQRFYPVPDAQKPRRILDFGAGHGRAANLAFFAPGAATKLMVSADAVPASYLTQRLYYEALGLHVADYLDAEDFDFAAAEKASQLIHIPAWRLDLLASDSFDMVTCVQVLKELPRRVLLHAVKQFARVLKPGGALYVRDHIQFHDLSGMPVDEILSTSGFVLEFQPRVKDREALHGAPRLWRKLDADLYLAPND